ncbi:GntR family transcriptional regulator [Murinocardiopsis flavida]|nr:GntR family transcriptional regulator [Murinocardiopsis flavida]
MIEWVADVLRGQIFEGTFEPGQRLREEKIGEILEVSRNTLREAFRLLGHERLVVHQFHRGVFVAQPSADDVADLYRVRRALELSAVRGASGAPRSGIDAVAAAVTEGEQALGGEDWWGIGTANMRFHEAITALAGSRRADEIMRQLLAEMRLVFHIMKAPREFHAPYLTSNRRISDLLSAGRTEDAEAALAAYFDIAERQLLEAYDRGGPAGPDAPG